MKLSSFSVLAAVALALATGSARSAPLEDRVSQFKHAIEKEAEARAAENGPNANGFRNMGLNPAVISASLDQLITQMLNPANGENFDPQFAQITSVFTSDEVRETTTNLLAEIHKERKDRTDAEAANLKALIDRVSGKVNQARKPEDLDDVIAELQKNPRNGGAGPNHALEQQANAALEFAKKWQDYLSHTANGQAEQARQDLQYLTQNNSGAEFIPRSKLLALETPGKLATATTKPETPPPASPVKAIMDGIKTLDDLAPALERLAPFRQDNSDDGQNAYNSVAQLLQACRDLKAGLPTAYSPGMGNNNSALPAAVRSQFFLLALQTRFESYQGAPPAATEKPVDYINRVIADAMGREDWLLLQDALEARNYLLRGNGVGIGFMNVSGIGSLVAASHQVAAGQFTLAVASYEAALKSNDDAIPAKLIGDKLAAIQRDHPKEYADGLQITISPPGPRTYQGSVPGVPNGGIRPSRYPMSNYPTAPIPSTLLSPGANAAPAPETVAPAASTNAVPAGP